MQFYYFLNEGVMTVYNPSGVVVGCINTGLGEVYTADRRFAGRYNRSGEIFAASGNTGRVTANGEIYNGTVQIAQATSECKLYGKISGNWCYLGYVTGVVLIHDIAAATLILPETKAT